MMILGVILPAITIPESKCVSSLTMTPLCMANYVASCLLPHVHAQGVKQSVCPSVVVVIVVVGTKIGEKLVCRCFELLKKAY